MIKEFWKSNQTFYNQYNVPNFEQNDNLNVLNRAKTKGIQVFPNRAPQSCRSNDSWLVVMMGNLHTIVMACLIYIYVLNFANIA